MIADYLPVALRTSPWRWSMAIGKLLSVWAQLTQHFNESTTLSALSHESHVTFRIASSGAKMGRPIVKSTSTLVQYPVTWKTSRLRDDKLPDLPLKKKASKSTCRRPLQFQVLVGLFRLVTSGGFLGTWRPSVMAELWLKVYPTGQDHAMKCGFQVVTPRIWDNTCKTETEWDWLGKIHHV